MSDPSPCKICSSIIGFIITFCYFIFLCTFLPQSIKFAADEASLTQFNLTNNTDQTNTTLFYDLAFNLSIRNPNKRSVGIYLYRIRAEARYSGRKFAMLTMFPVPTYLGHKNTTVLRPILQGQQLLSTKDYKKMIKKYNSEASTGIFSVDVKLPLLFRLRYGKIKTRRYKHLDDGDIKCKLKVPLRGSNGTSSDFKAIGCGTLKTRISDGPVGAEIAGIIIPWVISLVILCWLLSS